MKYKIDLYFLEQKLALRVDDKSHMDRNETEEEESEIEIKEYLNCESIRLNPDKEDCDRYNEFSRIQNYISNSNKKSTKKYLIDKISRRLLELKFKSNHSVK